MRHPLTTTPTALASITVGTRYSLQNRSGRAIYAEVAAVAPTDSGGAFIMSPAPGPTSAGIAKADSGQSIYVWTAAAGGAIVYDEAP